ncbi:MAG: UDP-2,3-diacylglucosamine diphosphatase [Gammaproteobacteria bacterium]|nr:UDP-2,3-diacylglucosamine diphosphatase [Gammaproteobacteria bacterium]
MNDDCLFVSDLHLDPGRPAATCAFLRFLAGRATTTGTLYILGDLFEFWIGDDADDPHSAAVVEGIRAYTAAGHRCRIMRGNRDFLLGSRFTSRTGAEVIADPAVVRIAGEPVLLMHGDLLCTDDHTYQRYRRRVHHPTLQALFLALPRTWRKAAGDIGRRRSRGHARSLSPAIMDVNATAVTGQFRSSGCRVLIHGHTHRPGRHEVLVDGNACTRIVLGDWYEHGSTLSASGGRYETESLPFD